MSTAWTLLAAEVCDDALRHLGVLGEGDTAIGEQMQTALRGLDIVLKELPVHGYLWPKLAADTALTWAGVQEVALPADYYGYPAAWKTVDGKRQRIEQLPHADWVRLADRDATGAVTHFYVSPANVLHVYPTPDADPGLWLQYQAIADDAELTLAPDVLQSWQGALGWGVADQIGLQAGAPQSTRVEVSQRWAAKRALLLASAVPSEPVEFGVAE